MENKPDYLFTVFKNNDLVTLLNSLQIMTKIVLNIGYCCSDHNNTSKQAPGPENRHSALYASIIAYLCLKRNKIFILHRYSAIITNFADKLNTEMC